MAAHDAEEIYRGGQERDQAWGVVRTPGRDARRPALARPRLLRRDRRAKASTRPVAMPGAPYMLQRDALGVAPPGAEARRAHR